MKDLIRLAKRLLANISNNTKLSYLRKQGAAIGERTRLNCRVSSFGSEPYLIEVGNDCLFAANINIITHDGGIKVLNTLDYFDGVSMDKIDKVMIGNNVYIGQSALIMPGVNIGDNCIIGAHSVVTKDIPNNSVAVGVPAKVIKDIDSYHKSSAGKLYPTGSLNRQEKKNISKIFLVYSTLN